MLLARFRRKKCFNILAFQGRKAALYADLKMTAGVGKGERNGQLYYSSGA